MISLYTQLMSAIGVTLYALFLLHLLYPEVYNRLIARLRSWWQIVQDRIDAARWESEWREKWGEA